MTKCISCGRSVDEVMLHRTGELGKDPEWMCMPCIRNSEPELAENIEEDEVLNDLNAIFYERKN